MQKNIIQEMTQITERTIILLDGRQVTVPLFRNFKVDNHDDQSFLLHLNIFESNNILHRALANLVIDMLSIHSMIYTATTTRALKKWFETVAHFF